MKEINDEFSASLLQDDNTEPIFMSANDTLAYEGARVCYVCEEEFSSEDSNLNKVRDHDHYTGKYLGACHRLCNLMRKEDRKIVGFAHNSSGYDSHIIIKNLKNVGFEKIDAIPINTEKFKMVRLDNLVFLDSLAFLSASLDKLVLNLRVSNHDFPILKQWVGDDEEKLKLLLRKGVYCYEYMTDMSKLKLPVPSKSKFFSQLTQKGISDEDYAHVQNLCKTFKCSNLRHLTELYVKSDVFLLAEVVTDLRNRVFKEFNLDMCHYLSLPHMAKDVMLKMTKVEMELITDMDMIFFLKQNIRGGLSYIATRHAEKKQGESLLYIDANNLYGKAMTMAMPLKNFEWMKEDEIDALNLENDISDDADTGYIFEVTLDYPSNLHVDHNSFPLAAEHITIDGNMLSEYAVNALQKFSKKKKYTSSKLCTTLNRRTKYVCHGMNLKLYLKLGMKLIVIHRGIKFTQKRFLKPFIDRCTKKRAEALTKTEKDLQKLIANSLFGKMIENGTSRMDVRFVTNRKNALIRNTDPRTHSFKIFDEDLSAAFMRKKVINLNQNWAVGFAILELSKYYMQKMFYERVKPAFNGRVSVLMTDTDSWILRVPTDSCDQACQLLGDVMDFSNYPQDHPLYDESVKNVTGYFKNESPQSEIQEMVGVRSKTYAVRTAADETSNKAKGVRSTVSNLFTMADYLKCVQTEPEEVSIEQYTIQSKLHRLKTIKQKKVAFSSFDDKRFLMCSVHSVPYGSILIEKFKKDKVCPMCKNKDLMI